MSLVAPSKIINKYGNKFLVLYLKVNKPICQIYLVKFVTALISFCFKII